MKIVEKLGRAGGPKNREKMKKNWDEKYGKDNWEVVYFYNDKIYTREQALKEFYELSYLEYLKNNKNIADLLCNIAKELYNPHAEMTGGVDLQVPAVTKALEQLGLTLKGNQRIAIGVYGTKQGIKYPYVSWKLSPYAIPLWCNSKIDVENFWQNYKYLAIKE